MENPIHLWHSTEARSGGPQQPYFGCWGEEGRHNLAPPVRAG
jgi:hypothetical protein